MSSVLTLSHDEALQLVERNHVARVAVSYHDNLEIAPVHYVFRHGSLYVRTSEGTKMWKLRHHPYVAVEVDEIDSLFAWRSVVIKGFVEILDPAVTPDRYAQAVSHVRELVPAALAREDPAPERDILLRIHALEVEGRQALPREHA